MTDQDGSQSAESHYELSRLLAKMGNLDLATKHAVCAAELVPGNALYYRNGAILFDLQEELTEAEVWLRRAEAVAPDDAETLALLVTVCRKLGKGEDAFFAARRCRELTPTNAKSAIVMAEVLLDALQFEDAAAQLAGFQGPDVDTMKTKISKAEQDLDSVCEVFIQAWHDAPETTVASSDFIETLLKLCDWKRSHEFVRQIIETIQLNLTEYRPIGISVNNLQAFPVSYEFIADIARYSAQAISEDLRKNRAREAGTPQKLIATARHGGKIRIGYAIPGVHFHSLPLLLKNIVARHDRERFEVFGFCVGIVNESEFSRGYRDAFDQFFDCDDDPDITAKIIQDNEIDILIDVIGQGVGHCLELLARRPAPLVVHYLGYSITTGADFIDYIVSDEIYLPARDMSLGPEMPIYLPNTFLAAVPMKVSKSVPTRRECGLPETGTVFCNFNQMFKLESDIFSVWCRILNAVEGSVMWLGGWSTAAMHNLRREARARGVDPDRLVFGKIVEHADHLARLCHADLSLDTFHHGGGVTTTDCLWAGVPVLTTRGPTPSSRLGNSILHGAGLDHLVLDDLAGYEKLAIELGNDPQKLSDLRQAWLEQKSTSAVRRHINWNNRQLDLKEDLAHLVQDIKRRICGIASAGLPLFSV